MCVRLLILLAYFDSIQNSNLLERFVPTQDSLPNPTSVAYGSRMLNVKNDWLLRRTQSQLGIALFKIPTINKSDVGIV